MSRWTCFIRSSIVGILPTFHKQLHPSLRSTAIFSYLIEGVLNNSDEQTQYNEDEERNENVEVDFTEVYYERIIGTIVDEHVRVEHIVTVEKGVETFWREDDGSELLVIWSKDDPPTQHETHVDEGDAANETEDVWKCYLKWKIYHSTQPSIEGRSF